MRIECVMRQLAEEQHGLAAIWQLQARGATANELYRLRRSEDWRALSRRVLARVGAPDTTEQRLTAAVLDASPGAALSGPSAAWLWGVPGYDAEPAHVVRPRGISRRSSVLATVHEVVDLGPRQIKLLRGIPVVSPGRLVCELAGTHPWRAARALDWLWSNRLLDGAAFRRTVGELRDRGRTGSTLFRELDEERGPSYVPPASALERRFEEVLQRHGEAPMVRQVDLGGQEWCGRVDYKDAHLPLLVEVQSERYHAALVDRVADAERLGRLELAGFTVLEVWDTEVWHQSTQVAERIRSARRQLRQLATIPHQKW